MASTLSHVLCVLPLVLASAASPARPPDQPPPFGPDRPGAADLARDLGLAGDAAARVDALAEQHHLAMYRMHREQMRARGQQRAQFRGELAKILSPEQLARFDALRPGQGQGHGQGRGHDRCRGPAAGGPRSIER